MSNDSVMGSAAVAGITPQFVMQARTLEIGELIEQCARGQLAFSGENSLCSKVSAMGFKTTSLYEMVLAAEYAIQSGQE